MNEPTYGDFLKILRRSTDSLVDDPIREEIFSVERLELYAAHLATELTVNPQPQRGKSLVREVRKNGRDLLKSYLTLANVIRSKQTVSPAAEWFVDNFHIVEEQLIGVKRDLPSNYYHELPKLANGELKGYPRVYAIALAIIAHTDSRLDAESLTRFLLSFQQVAPLDMGELWAMSITLRIALIQQLKPLAQLIVTAREKRAHSDAVADRLLEVASHSKPESLIAILNSELRKPEEFDRSFIVQLVQRLRDQDPDVWPAFDWLEKQLLSIGTNTVQVIQLEHHRQAAAQVTVGNIIGSMRLLSNMDWRDFFEAVSTVDPLLARDPAGIYSQMDFSTRDRYRHSVGRIARRTDMKVTESDVINKALDLAKLSQVQDPADLKRCHIGYYLFGEGLENFEKIFRYKAPLRTRILRWVNRYPNFVYFSSVIFLTLLILAPITYFSIWWVALLAIAPASEMALAIFNNYITYFISPRALPKLDFESGIPDHAKTFVVIPTLFIRESIIRELLDHLEVQYLANQDPNISFALLGDFADSIQETLPTDEGLLTYAQEGVRELNQRYAANQQPRFYVFLRRRLWNSSEQRWMGWERKRGKLLEFNRVLRGETDTTYLPYNLDRNFAGEVKYIITLDSDTQLPRSTAHRLIGTIAHPLNQPLYDPKLRRVTEGYGILQPRVSVSLLSAASSRFAKIFSGNIGLDPYTTAVSDVYQDLFAEGSFTGKGLYVIDAFEEALLNRVPENSVLSHDLFEGSYARSALVTDVEIFDDYPTDYETFSKRAHRWTRGDWQLLPWLFWKVKDARGRWVKNDLNLIARWKIFDNLRRSLTAPMTLLLLICGWTVLPGHPAAWTALVLGFLGFQIYRPLLTFNLVGFAREFGLTLQQTLLTTAFLPDQSYMQVDAIVRTAYRKLISHRHLLQWVSFAQVQSERKNKDAKFRWQDPGLILSALLATYGVAFDVPTLLVMTPFLIAWTTTPLAKRWLHEKPTPPERPLGHGEIATYRRYARRTWHFFEKFVGPEGNWLAPDNFQEDPKPVIAFRTSPTNIGLQFLAMASAYDFGYVGVHELVEKLENTFRTLTKLPGMRGHLFNWYDTKSLEPLRPQYISTVDSGNLAGHLLTLKQACFEISQKPFFNPKARMGLADTLEIVLEQTLILKNANLVADTQGVNQLLVAVTSIRDSLDAKTWATLVQELTEQADLLQPLERENPQAPFQNVQVWLNAALNQAREALRDERHLFATSPAATTTAHSAGLANRLKGIMDLCENMAMGMDFRFLFDEHRKIFAIGFNSTEGRLDNSFYDLLASESRLASFVAIAKGDIAQEHWFRLGRALTAIKGSRALIAWTATMFEYLMPLLVMRRYPDTLLDETYVSVVFRQREYGRNHGIPWGVSEAGYNARDLNLNYQYGPFGIPGLGLKRGLSDDMVISPYSTMLAAMVAPWTSLANLQDLEKLGVLSTFGFYESVDYTPDRLPKGKKFFIIKSFMAHHQGMSLVSINNLLNHQVMQTRFHNEPMVKATELLLQERVPSNVTITRPRAEEVHSETSLRFHHYAQPRVYTDVNLSTPRTQLLSNGNYSVMVTTAGGGYSRHDKLSISRWREDSTRDNWGHFFYIRNRETESYWSATHQPVIGNPKNYEVTFAEDKVEFWRTDQQILTHTEIIVSPEDNVELRRLTLTNNSSSDGAFDITSYMEATLSKPQDDAAHPAFSNLFVQTEYVASQAALLATRRRRSANEKQVWGFHVVSTDGFTIGPVQYETDRARFIGRGRSVANPLAVTDGGPLSNTTGSVLDPILSLRISVRVLPGSTVQVTFATGVANSREDALRLADKYHDIPIFSRETEIAWTKSQVQLRHLNISPEVAHVFQRLAGRVIFSDASLRPRSHVLALNTRTQSSLWAYGISGDLPIILMRISDEKDMAMVRELLHGHEYLRLKGLIIDLVILNERPPSYMQSLQEELQRQLRMSGSQALLDKPGGVFIRRTDVMPEADVILLKAVARVVFSAAKGTLDEQLRRRAAVKDLPNLLPSSSSKIKYPKILGTQPNLQFFNGFGGFTTEENHYVILLRDSQWTPAPWINVIANDQDFGFLVSEAGAGYTWSTNSRENRLSSWSNDAISDPVSEAIYIRDEDTGEFWTPTPLPVREAEPYTITHAQGFSKFEHTSHGIASHLLMFVPRDASVKISRLRLRNLGTLPRRLSVSSFVEWVLGFQRGVSAPSVITEKDPVTGALLARNPYNNEFAGRVAFADLSETDRTYTCDRKEFLGRNGSPAEPEAMKRVGLSGRTGAGFDPCAAFHTVINLEPGEERELIFLLGQTENVEEARRTTIHYREKTNVQTALQNIEAYWNRTLSTIEIKTPDAAMNMLVNRWLLYQTLSCRIWARSAFYQSGGAYGFRDQLQDVMALVYSNPEIAKQQILRAAQRQFVEGDVQHWWHPPTGRGVRTRFSDDLLWLPFVVSFYIKVTGDREILNHRVPFIEGPVLESGVDDSYTQPHVSDFDATIFEHCARTIDRSLAVGSHGLPLMGSGDWNDGMNRVGNEGRGESVWVAWFLHSTINQFLPYCESPENSERRDSYQQHLIALKEAIENNAWDGDWYRRAYFDNGQSLGSASNSECRIDSIAQSWAILSGAGDLKRAKRAMAAVDEHLIHEGDGLIKLFSPPFDKSSMDPGYIKGYLPGVRENGGQYTHAAIWTMMAYAALGEGDRAGELYALLNPINHAMTPAGAKKYKVEPYVVAADIYGLYPHVGRGGWTWYTGSASWMYRSAIESILGFDLRGTTLRMNPCIPRHWRNFELTYRTSTTTYHILVTSTGEPYSTPQIKLDGTTLSSPDIPLAEDGTLHRIEIHL